MGIKPCDIRPFVQVAMTTAQRQVADLLSATMLSRDHVIEDPRRGLAVQRRYRRVGAHPAGVRPGVAITHAFVVLHSIEQDARAELPTGTEEARLMRRYDYGDTALFMFGPASDRSAS